MTSGRTWGAFTAGAAAALLLGAFGGSAASMTATGSAVTEDPVLLAAGDIAGCDSRGDEATAAILDANPQGTVAPLGDLAYLDGTLAEFEDCYGPTWGRHKDRTLPAVGNHEYNTVGAAGYFDYFGAAAGDRDKGYYSYDLGSWHIIVLNSNCSQVGGCRAGSPQETWLRADLAAHPVDCTLAYWHHPRFSSGLHGNDPRGAAFWDALYSAGAEIVLSGHDHTYERFEAQTPVAAADPEHGIVEFVVGSGGRSHYAFGTIQPNSAARDNETYGVLKLVLRSGGYDWEFLPEAGKTFTDTGTASCHSDSAAPVNPTLSSTHSDAWSNDNTVDITWSGASDEHSGVDGFSYEFSQSEITTPDTVKDAEETATGTTSEPLIDGEWWFHLRTGDNAGNWSPPVQLGPFRMDTTPPETALVAEPPDFAFTASEQAAFRCALDGGPAADCTPPVRHETLAPGEHVFRVHAIDRAGNVDASPAEHRWTIAAAPPPSPPPPPPPPPPPAPPPPPSGQAARCGVPRLAGRTLSRARLLAARAGCRLGSVSRVHSARIVKGRIVTQRPRPGLRVKRGARINVTVSLGRR